ncbi:MAG TPA: magnesium transporter [Thermomicrobiaceae bacterium]|nr:magnesium transporter [Thermomicrobiaceae bacterium]
MTAERERVPSLEAGLERGDTAELTAALRALTEQGGLPERLARLTPADARRLAELLGDDALGELLAEIDPYDAAALLSRLAVVDAADVLEAMEPDDAADVVGEFAPEEADRILVAMEPIEAAELRDLLSYPPDSAGGRMTPAYVAVSPDLTVRQAIAALQKLAEAAETVAYVYVTDAQDHLLGVLSLRRLVLSPPDTPIARVIDRDVVSVPVTADQEHAARLLMAENFLALPVVDAENRLLGIITADDVADIIEQETTEDIERLGGSEPLEEPYLRASPQRLWRKRVGWLLALFFAEAYTGTVLRHYQSEVETVVALSFFIPLLIGTGGNVGSQVVTTIVRAMAVGDVRFGDMFRIVRKEFITGIMLGVVMAAATFIRAMTLRVGVDVGLTVAMAVTAIVIWAAIVGAILPLVLHKLRVDPAVVSAPFISTLVDGTGLVIYFNVARLFLRLH